MIGQILIAWCLYFELCDQNLIFVVSGQSFTGFLYYPGELSLSMSDRLLMMETTCSDNVHAVLQVELRR
ncbi:hypothetical protein EY313_20225 [Shigella sonnei]|nr:hypothetical protein [Shigella sonnei]EFX2807989.1 hypothetical protein [Shigella sonnei]EFX2812581.1 hypothetical protein [Shigella sonnei]EFX4128519.1 hypothetical protein [Shigella sonnei]EGD6125407.1 hypothetical protein [Shigella sonnei]